jgi:spermidine/putrescine transport system substrate-binding protein
MIRRSNGPFAPHDKSWRQLNRRQFLRRTALAGGALATAGSMVPFSAQAADAISFLTWCDHVDSRLIGGYEEKTGVKVNAKTYEGTGSALALKDQSSAGDWDLFCLDFQDTPMVANQGYLKELDDNRVPWDSFFTGIREQPHAYTNGKLYGVPDKFGYYGVAYNKDKVDEADMRSAEIMFSDKYKGRMAVYDYYVPIIQLVGLSQGIAPKDITVENLDSSIRKPLLKLKSNSVVVGDIVTVLNALHGGSADMIVGGAEWSVALDMVENKSLDYSVFDEGALLWNESLGIFVDSEHEKECWDFIDWTLSPEGQRYLATSECFWACPVRKDTPLTEEEAGILRWDQQVSFLKNSHPSTLGSPDLDAAMLDLWQEFLAS